jgi:GNAT superfamily N-acetyltransferase
MKKSQPQSYFVLVILDTASDKVVAVGSLFLEYKFIRNLGSAGHIEDIAVDTSVQGKGLGKKMINALTLLSESLGAYKVILDCSAENQGEIYELCDIPPSCCADTVWRHLPSSLRSFLPEVQVSMGVKSSSMHSSL